MNPPPRCEMGSLNQGLEPGGRVAVHWTISVPAVQLLYGLFKAGLVAVTVNTRLKTLRDRIHPQLFAGQDGFTEPLLSPVAQQAGTACPIFTQLPALENGNSNKTQRSRK
jgi:long-chain acyl-CoA synthetase